MSTAAELLKAARTARGFSQSRLAEQLGTTQTVISAYERGRRDPGVLTLQRMLAATGHELELRAISAHPWLMRRIDEEWKEMVVDLDMIGADAVRLQAIETDEYDEPVIVVEVEVAPDVTEYLLDVMRKVVTKTFGVAARVVVADAAG